MLIKGITQLRGRIKENKTLIGTTLFEDLPLYLKISRYVSHKSLRINWWSLIQSSPNLYSSKSFWVSLIRFSVSNRIHLSYRLKFVQGSSLHLSIKKFAPFQILFIKTQFPTILSISIFTLLGLHWYVDSPYDSSAPLRI